ncbi:Phenylacetone monooxygenase [Hyphomicrobiales bacterium]|nr:Phenylacetone monooxygenase [Hyphomicrobiales bacterium]CAH1693475.1 Phenylacetone monooxygenase [Hyphomicrobiales bacterium]
MTEANYGAVVVGAGFAGLRMLWQLRQLGLTAVAFERGDDIGGTWYWNCYPGARCDVESLQYSYGFSETIQQEWDWSERFATQPEILNYINHVADKLDLRRDVRLATTVTAATYDRDRCLWTVQTDRGGTVQARFFILATGCLSSATIPKLPNLEHFEGPIYHTGTWPRDTVDFSGKRVGVIGTGSSGVQCIPPIAEQAEHLTVFQRTPHFSVPARNRPLTAEEVRHCKANYAELREQAHNTQSGVIHRQGQHSIHEVSDEARKAEFEARWLHGGTGFTLAFQDLMTSEENNAYAAEFVRAKIREIVRDRDTAERLVPKGYPLGAKRLVLHSGYYETFNRPNVSLVDLRNDPIKFLEASGVRTRAGLHQLDCLVFATGFDAMTGSILKIDIQGAAGLSLREKWAAGPRTYLGLMTSGFPNMFMITGPGSPSVKSNMVLSIEQHVEWLGDMLSTMIAHNRDEVYAEPRSESEWVAHVNAEAEGTLFANAASWYNGSNIPGKPRVFMPYVGGVKKYRQICSEVARNDYRGLRFR